MHTTRREFIRLTASLALLSLGGRGGADETGAGPADDDANMLADIVYQLFPHPGLGQDVYTQVTARLGEKIEQSSALTTLLDEAMQALAGEPPEGWATLSASQQTAALERIQHTPFFQFVLNETLALIYRHPRTWELLGYEGSSLEFGGYINRGFNDIDWLER